MKLIGTHTSPYVRKVRIVLAEKKMEYDFVVESPREPGSTLLDINPLGRVPTLVLDDDTPLFDSRVIVEYIDNITPNNKLFPGTNRERTEVKRWEALADGLCETAINIVLENRRPKKEQSPDWISRQQDILTRTLAFMESQLGDKSFCLGTHFSLADIVVGVALGYLDLRFEALHWAENYPNLARLNEKLLQRPAFSETVLHD
ncbi:glutathione S-transferase family protein [Azonexus sp.]|uniref:glutathione S-transferase family protein n=1 Tax=Azonexus sp. TaxID=1872668 RepID=UPI0039E6C12D